MDIEGRQDLATKSGALRRFGEQPGMKPEALRTWDNQAGIDGGVLLGASHTPRAADFAVQIRKHHEHD